MSKISRLIEENEIIDDEELSQRAFDAEMEEFIMDYNAEDRYALLNILHICPRHGTSLQPVALLDEVWGCKQCNETWYLPVSTSPEVSEGGQKHEP